MTAKQRKKLQSLNLGKTSQLIRFNPNYYHDVRFINRLDVNFNEQNIAILGRLTQISCDERNGKLLIKARIEESGTGRKLFIVWFGNYNIYKTYRYSIDCEFLVYGKLKFDPGYKSFSMANPFLFTTDIQNNARMIPVYKKFKGLSKESLEEAIYESVITKKEEYVPQKYLNQYNIFNVNDAATALHFPISPESAMRAQQRFDFDDMLEFAIKMKQKEIPSGFPMIDFKTSELTSKIIEDLPYTLTNDQRIVVESLYAKIRKKEKVNALIQGDVSCGKTITAFLLMFLASENGYQSIIMAPTNVLASQHYSDLEEMGLKWGKKVVFLKSGMKVGDKREVKRMIKEGEADFIVATHSAIYDVDYANLGLVVIDEEHKFGVETREKLKEKSAYEIPFITMSATPIPRTLATAIYGNSTDIFTIESMPSGRKPVKTIVDTSNRIPALLTEQLKQGRQAYVVCPLIEKAEEDSIMSKCISVDETLSTYQAFYTRQGIIVEALTGKTSKEETERILKDFKENKIQVLISTTVIEVGVNNPNATVIVLQNAERYGLTSMHQLRGRVRRGSYDPYYILCCEQGTENKRVNMMCQTDNGFKIAEADLEMRKCGDLIGVKQSGANKVIDLILKYPKMYEIIKEIGNEMIKEDNTAKFIDYMENINS